MRALPATLIIAAIVSAACGAPPEDSQTSSATTAPASAGDPASVPAAATAAANSGIEKAGAETGKAIQTADRAMNKALTEPELGDKAAAGVNKLATKLTGALGALDRRGRNAAMKAGLPTQRGTLKSRDAAMLVVEFSAANQTQTARYAVTADTTFVDDLKPGELATVTYLRDGNRQIAVSVARYEPEEP
jgi:hypothetical protein